MKNTAQFDVIIIGGSYSGLAAGMALGRALRRTLIIDGGTPCNRQTPFSHNFLTQDGKPPGEISALGRKQVEQYDTVTLINDWVTDGRKTAAGFEIHTAAGQVFSARKLIFATGIKDRMPPVGGYAECWGISVLHCPYCHGYEVRNKTTGILGNGDHGFEFSALISNWTSDLTLFTNGKPALTPVQAATLEKRKIRIVEKTIERLEHVDGALRAIIFSDQSSVAIDVLYAQSAFTQQCTLPEALGCGLTAEGYVQTDPFQKATVPGIYACGDTASRMRTVANAVASGTTAGMMVNKELVMEEFLYAG